MPAVAFSNNDIAVVAWTFDKHLDGCLGFAVHQIDGSGNTISLEIWRGDSKETLDVKLGRQPSP